LFVCFILQHTNLLSSCFIIHSPINRFSQRGGCISRGSEATIATTTTAIGGDDWPRAFCAAIGLLQFHRTLPRQFCGRTGTTQLVWCRSSHDRQQTNCVAPCYASLWLSRFIAVCVTLLIPVWLFLLVDTTTFAWIVVGNPRSTALKLFGLLGCGGGGTLLLLCLLFRALPCQCPFDCLVGEPK
jgi:hypothetical protein